MDYFVCHHLIIFEMAFSREIKGEEKRRKKMEMKEIVGDDNNSVGWFINFFFCAGHESLRGALHNLMRIFFVFVSLPFLKIKVQREKTAFNFATSMNFIQIVSMETKPYES